MLESASRQLADEANKAAEESRWKQSEQTFSKIIQASEAIGPEAKEAHEQAEEVLAKAAAEAEKIEAAAEAAASETKSAAEDIWVDLSRRDTLTAEALGQKIAADISFGSEDGKAE